MRQNIEQHIFVAPQDSDPEDPHREKCAKCGKDLRSHPFLHEWLEISRPSQVTQPEEK